MPGGGGVEGGISLVVKTQSARVWPTFHFRGGGEGEGKGEATQEEGILGKMSKHSFTWRRVSHTLRVWRLIKWQPS